MVVEGASVGGGVARGGVDAVAAEEIQLCHAGAVNQTGAGEHFHLEEGFIGDSWTVRIFEMKSAFDFAFAAVRWFGPSEVLKVGWFW